MRKCESLGKELLLLPWKEVRRKTNLPRNDVVWMLPFAISMTLRVRLYYILELLAIPQSNFYNNTFHFNLATLFFIHWWTIKK